MDYVVAIAKMDELQAYLAGRRGALETMVRGQNEAKALLKYRKAMEISTIKLKAGGNPATLVETIAKGMCGQDEADLIQARVEFKACLALMDCAAKELNSLQSQTRIKE
ncbi:hypothetical protein LCGC14_1066730 [marine sediment metagenome]|uniref:Uncharacterized protein n=1 Tax=marine sediment metagenome TaxID=412755 RepID=A0A0F9N6I0_9ZZZZ